MNSRNIALEQLADWCEVWGAEISELQAYGLVINFRDRESVFFELTSINHESIIEKKEIENE